MDPSDDSEAIDHPAPDAETPDDAEMSRTRMTLGEHLDDLRRRILLALVGLATGTLATAMFGRTIFELLNRPYVRAMQRVGLPTTLMVPTYMTAFMVYFRVVLLSGLILSSPWVFYQVWAFVSAGLYRRERRMVMRAVPFSAALFVAGALFFAAYVAEPIIVFFASFTQWMPNLAPQFRQEDHIDFITHMMFVFGLAFQTPLVVWVVAASGLVSLKTLRHYRRHVVVAMLIFAACVTSPSPVDQILLALPMWMLYELGLVLAWLSIRRREREDT